MKNNFPMDELVSAEERIELKFLENHTHFLTGEIDDDSIRKVIQWITYENMHDGDKNKILTLYVNSSGGDLYQAFALIDTMKRSKYPVCTIGMGSIMSAGFLIFASGRKGHRYISENTGIMCHQFSDSQDGKYHDIKAQAKENELCNQRMLKILREASGLPERSIKSKLLGPSDAWFTAEELIELKIADHIL